MLDGDGIGRLSRASTSLHLAAQSGVTRMTHISLPLITLFCFRDIIVIAVAASALVILHLVIKQRELEFLDKQEPSRQSSGDGEEQPLKASETLEEAGVSWQASTNITQFGTGSTL